MKSENAKVSRMGVLNNRLQLYYILCQCCYTNCLDRWPGTEGFLSLVIGLPPFHFCVFTFHFSLLTSHAIYLQMTLPDW